MPQPTKGDKVKVHYIGQLNDGDVFDSSDGKDPLEFTIGAGQIIPGFEQAVIGLEIGISTTVTIPAAEAYGERNEDMVLPVKKEQFPDDFVAEVGQTIRIPQSNDEYADVVIKEITDDQIVLDANHKLAGEDLTFDIELVSIG